jgi:hypothetical protein
LAEEQVLHEIGAEKDEERSTRIKLLENRTMASRSEIEMTETLEELSKCQVAVNYDAIIIYIEHQIAFRLRKYIYLKNLNIH